MRQLFRLRWRQQFGNLTFFFGTHATSARRCGCEDTPAVGGILAGGPRAAPSTWTVAAQLGSMGVKGWRLGGGFRSVARGFDSLHLHIVCTTHTLRIGAIRSRCPKCQQLGTRCRLFSKPIFGHSSTRPVTQQDRIPTRPLCQRDNQEYSP